MSENQINKGLYQSVVEEALNSWNKEKLESTKCHSEIKIIGLLSLWISILLPLLLSRWSYGGVQHLSKGQGVLFCGKNLNSKQFIGYTEYACMRYTGSCFF